MKVAYWAMNGDDADAKIYDAMLSREALATEGVKAFRNHEAMMAALEPFKDVEALHIVNLGYLRNVPLVPKEQEV